VSELAQIEKYRQGIADARTEAERLRAIATHASVTAWIRVVIRDLDDADRWIAETREGFRFAMADISISAAARRLKVINDAIGTHGSGFEFV
jgi:hypothetical protein